MSVSAHLFEIVSKKLEHVRSDFDLMLDNNVAISILEKMLAGETSFSSVDHTIKTVLAPQNGSYLGRKVIASCLSTNNSPSAVIVSYIEPSKHQGQVSKPKKGITFLEVYGRADALLLEDGRIGFAYTINKNRQRYFITGKMSSDLAMDRDYVKAALAHSVRAYKQESGVIVPQLTKSYEFLPHLALLAAKSWSEYRSSAANRIDTSYYGGKPS